MLAIADHLGVAKSDNTTHCPHAGGGDPCGIANATLFCAEFAVSQIYLWNIRIRGNPNAEMANYSPKIAAHIF
jgi:hypothetical protein